MERKSFYANGKLLISGEYLVMDGAVALALPLQYGQTLEISETKDKGILDWKSFEYDEQWFHARFDIPSFKIIDTSGLETAEKLQHLLQVVNSLNPMLNAASNYEVNTRLSFRRDWGFGSSSTLVSTLAQWFGIDPYELFRAVYTGSGYDVACASSDRPLLYQLQEGKPEIKKVQFRPAFRDHIYLVYLGEKQDTGSSIRYYSQVGKVSRETINRVSGISLQMANAGTLTDFEELIREHESILSQVLGISPVKEKLFHDFEGAIKSLGAWGGDFIMTTWKKPRKELEHYFNKKGLNVIFSFEELSL